MKHRLSIEETIKYRYSRLPSAWIKSNTQDPIRTDNGQIIWYGPVSWSLKPADPSWVITHWNQILHGSSRVLSSTNKLSSPDNRFVIIHRQMTIYTLSHLKNDQPWHHHVFPAEDAYHVCDLFVFPTCSKRIYAQPMHFAAFIFGRACLRHGCSWEETKYRELSQQPHREANFTKLQRLLTFKSWTFSDFWLLYLCCSYLQQPF